MAVAAAAPLAGHLSNGRDFSGWKQYGNGLWSLEEGAFVGRCNWDQPGPGYLFTEREFSDFRLQLEFWITPHGNSGVYVRQPLREFGTTGNLRPAQQPGDGVEIQVDYHDRKNLTGAVYNRRNVSVPRGGEDRWNHYRIECRGPRLRVWIDGELVNDFSPLPQPRGAIGLQIHGGKPHKHVIRYRNIRLTEL